MRLEPPLKSLFDRCMTFCVAECCGIDAYDFSPIHIASYLLMHRGAPDVQEIAMLREQLAALKGDYGPTGAVAQGVSLDDANQGLTASEVAELVDEISANLEIAVETIAEVEARCARRASPSSLSSKAH